ncbi:MAG: S9 family peptidase, partial [Halieaceae bacterium]|nr:S9 family peptidase [Halieaceae bacterium]
ALSSSAQDEPSRRAATIDDLLSIESVGDPRISPDGRWIAYTVEAADWAEDQLVSRLFMVSADGKETVRLTGDDYSATSPRWSPDNRYLGFLAARGEDDARTQVWLFDRRGGDARQYTAVDQGVSGFEWSPDGTRMLLTIRDKTAQELAAEAAEEAGEEAKPLPFVIDRLQFKRDGVPYLDRSRTHIYIWDGKADAPTQLTFGDFDDLEPAWSPDGRRIAFVSNRSNDPDANMNTDIWVVSADAAESDAQPRRITSNPGSDESPAWSPDSTRIAYVTVTQPELIWYATNHLAVADADGGGERVLSAALDRNVSAPVFAPDGASIWFSLEDSAEQHLASFNLESGEIDRPVRGKLSVGAFDVHGSGDVVLGLSKPSLPTELFYLRDGDLRQLTHSNRALLAALRLAEVKNIQFLSRDGTEVEGFVFTPPDYQSGQRYPTILRIHGGPVSQYDFSFNDEAQLLAAHGFVVVICNPRGSSGYGQDFSAALFARWGEPDFEDVMAAVDYAVALGYADAERLGVGGWSYGGILTNYVITKTDRFARAITGASEVNYIANYGHDHYQYHWEQELGLPWENKEAWERISPWEDVDRISTPTLVIGGREDWNVPIQNSEQLYQALKRRGVDTQLVVYPDESHDISRPSFRKDRWERYLDWYAPVMRGR